jgi:hypothetical protein
MYKYTYVQFGDFKIYAINTVSQNTGGGDVPKFEPRIWLNVRDIEKIIRKLRRINQKKTEFI